MVIRLWKLSPVINSWIRPNWRYSHFYPGPRFVWFVSIKYSNTRYIQAIGAAYELNAEINVSKDKLLDKLYTLEEDGPTALGMSIVLLLLNMLFYSSFLSCTIWYFFFLRVTGPALLVATSLASKRAGSSIIICTDGLANVGVTLTKAHENITVDSQIW